MRALAGRTGVPVAEQRANGTVDIASDVPRLRIDETTNNASGSKYERFCARRCHVGRGDAYETSASRVA